MDMTATERLRALLDERGVEWEDTLASEGADGIIAEYAAKLRLAGDAE